MFRLQYLMGSSVAVLGLALLLGAWAQPRAAAAGQSYLTDNDIQKALSDPQTAALVDSVARRLPGNENLWYVLVLQTGRAQGIRIVQASGKTAAAVQIAKFLQQNPQIARNPQSYSRWLSVETYRNGEAAAQRCQALSNYARQSGYRR